MTTTNTTRRIIPDREDLPRALSRDPQEVLTRDNMPECDVIDAHEVVGTGLDFGNIGRIQAENDPDGYAWIWGDIMITRTTLDGRDPWEVHALLARKVENVGDEWADITDDEDLLVCSRVWLDTPEGPAGLSLSDVLAKLNVAYRAVHDLLATREAQDLPRIEN